MRQLEATGAIGRAPPRDEDAQDYARQFAVLRAAWDEAHGQACAAEAELDAAWQRHFAHGAPAPGAERIQHAIALRGEAIRRGQAAAAFMRSRPI